MKFKDFSLMALPNPFNYDWLTVYLSGNTFCPDNSGNGTEFYSTFFEWWVSFMLSYSLYAILVPLVVMIIKIPFSSPLDMFPKNNIWGALCFDFGFWHFMTALSLVYAIIMVVIQFIQFVTALRQSGKRLLSVCVIYFPVMFSLFILSMYAVIGVVLLFIIKFALSVMEENSRK